MARTGSPPETAKIGIVVALVAMAFAATLSFLDVSQRSEAWFFFGLGLVASGVCWIVGFERTRIPLFVATASVAGGILAAGCHYAEVSQEFEAFLCFCAVLLFLFVHILFFQRSLLAFLIRRFALMIVTLLGITLVTFVIIRAAPGDPGTLATGPGGAGGGVSQQQMARTVQKSQRELLGILQKYTFKAVATDPNGEPIQLVFDWGDGTDETRTSFLDSGSTFEAEHAFDTEGTFEIKCQAVDRGGARSPWSEIATIVIKEKNVPPALPTFTGPSECGLRDKPTFTASSKDPEGRPIRFTFDWGEGKPEEVPADASGSGSIVHQFEAAGSYRVRVAAADDKGAFSGWTETRLIVVRDGNSPGQPKIDVPSAWALNREFVARAQVPEGGQDAAIEFEFGEKDDRVKVVSEVAKPGTWVTAKHVVRNLPDNDKKDLRVRVRSVSGNATSGWKSKRFPITEANLPPDRPGAPQGPSKGVVNRPYILQYFTWVWRCARLDFGRSMQHGDYIVDLRSREAKEKSGRKPGDYAYWGILWPRIKNTMSLEIWSFLLIYIIAVPIGIYSSTHHKSVLDRFITFILFVLYSLPSFWVATMLIVLVTPYKEIPFIGIKCSEPQNHVLSHGLQNVLLLMVIAVAIGALVFRVMRRAGIANFVGIVVGMVACPLAYLLLRKAFLELHPLFTFAAAMALLISHVFLDPGKSMGARTLVVLGISAAIAFILHALARIHFFWHAFLPVVCLTYGGLAALSRYARSGMLEVVRQDYIRTARAKGLSEKTVILKHALRNGMIPIVTLLANLLPYMIGGAIIIEFIFSIDGMGNLAFKAINDRDYNVVMAVTTLSAVMTLIGILISDILYVLVDPRISFESLEGE